MNTRRIATVLVLLVVTATLLPAAAAADPGARFDAPDSSITDLFVRALEWLQNAASHLFGQFEAAEGASITSNG